MRPSYFPSQRTPYPNAPYVIPPPVNQYQPPPNWNFHHSGALPITAAPPPPLPDVGIEAWRRKYYQQKKKPLNAPKCETNTPSLSIPAYRSLLRITLETRNACEKLCTQVHEDVMSKKVSHEKLQAQREEIEQYKAFLQENETILLQNKEVINRKLKNRMRKRQRVGRKKEKLHSQKRESMLRRAEAHAETDAWLARRRAKEAQREEMRKHARLTRSVLSDVRRRKAEIHESVQRIEALQRLRHLRLEEATQKGRLIADSFNDIFEKEVDSLLTLMRTQLQSLEEEEEKQKDELQLHAAQSKTRPRNQRDAYFQLLFGSEGGNIVHLFKSLKHSGVISFYYLSPTCIFHKLIQLFFIAFSVKLGDMNCDLSQHNSRFFNQALLSLDSFVQLRSQWDGYLSDGDHIGPGWVIPQSPHEAGWSDYLHLTYAKSD